MLTRRFQAALKEDRGSRVKRPGKKIGALVSNDQVREAWSKNQRWYQEAKGHRVPPTSDQLDQTSTLREYLYRHRPTESKSIPILLQQVSIKDGSPEVGI